MIRLGIFSSRRRHTRYSRDWSSDVCSSDLVSMVAGRTFAMAANRILDRKIDALNPRTRNRELVTGAVSVRTAWTGAVISLVFFFLAAALLNPDRKSTRLNSSHANISYAVFCLKKK